MDGEHLSQRVFVLRGVQVAVQKAAHHVQEGRVVLLQLHLACGNTGSSLFLSKAAARLYKWTSADDVKKEIFIDIFERR